MSDDVIRIVCDATRHAGRDVHVAAFGPNDPLDGWHQVVTTKARPKKGGGMTGDAGETMFGNVPFHRANVPVDAPPDAYADSRHVWLLECRKCHQPLSLRDESLEKALDGFRKLGWSIVPMSVFAATVGRSQ